MANLLGYEIAESMIENQVQLMMTQIMCSPTKMKVILGLDENSDVDHQQLRINTLQAFRHQLKDNSSGLSDEALSLFSAEVTRLAKVFSIAESSQTLHGHSHSCRCEDFTSALKAQNNS